jgi:hypothetical protein
MTTQQVVSMLSSKDDLSIVFGRRLLVGEQYVQQDDEFDEIVVLRHYAIDQSLLSVLLSSIGYTYITIGRRNLPTNSVPYADMFSMLTISVVYDVVDERILGHTQHVISYLLMYYMHLARHQMRVLHLDEDFYLFVNRNLCHSMTQRNSQITNLDVITKPCYDSFS